MSHLKSSATLFMQYALVLSLLLVRTLPGTLLCHEACGKTDPSCILSIQHQQNHALQNWFFLQLKPDSGIKWEMHIAHLIPWMPFATTMEIVCWKALEVSPSLWDSGGTFVSQMKWFSIHSNSGATTMTACLYWSNYLSLWQWYSTIVLLSMLFEYIPSQRIPIL